MQPWKDAHTRCGTELTPRLANSMGSLDDEFNQIRWGVVLHNIGKMGFPDHVLRKPGV